MLWVALLACNMPLGGPQVPTQRPVPTEAQQPSTNWQEQFQNAQPGDSLTITLTEQDLTGILADAVRSNPDMQIQNPRVVLKDGVMQVYGQTAMDTISANFRIDLNVKVDNQGKLQLEVVAADFGGIPVPQSMRDRLAEFLNETMQASLGPAGDRFRANQVSISEGLITVNGTVQ
jgi:uncharacterized protein YpmS